MFSIIFTKITQTTHLYPSFLAVPDGSTNDNRQGRVGLSVTASSSSKAKREQALRNILTARRRQLLGAKPTDSSKNQSAKTSRPVADISKDSLDMLDAQETRHGIYVTAPAGDQVSVIMSSDEDAIELLSQENLTVGQSREAILLPPENAMDDSTKNSLLIMINETSSPWAMSDPKTNVTVGVKNISQSSRAQKILENENRRKNIVAMPDSLYNHFRPVESNIPVEDMSQFLYFGQKLNPETQNSSSKNNNSLIDLTSTSSSSVNHRRRSSTKRFGTTTPIAVSRLENIMNEEMNVALESSTIERNKIPKMKNVLRNVGSGNYFRKTSIRPSDPTIVSNVILTRETPRNSSVASYNRENLLPRKGGVQTSAEGDLTAPGLREQAIVEAAAMMSGEGRKSPSDSIAVAASAHRAWNLAEKDERRHPRGENIAPMSKVDMRLELLANKNTDSLESIEKIRNTDGPIPRSLTDRDYSNMEKVSTSRIEIINRITTWQSVHTTHETTTSSSNSEPPNDARMSFSTMNDLTGPADSKLSSITPTVTTNAAPSSLRIIVTEPVSYDVKDTKESVARQTNEKKHEIDAGELKIIGNRAFMRKNETINKDYKHVPSPVNSKILVPTATTSISAVNSTRDPSPFGLPSQSTSPVKGRGMDNYQNPRVSPVDAVESAKSEKSEHGKQQHAYAYEITNVTRLLRNYTGPGLSIAVEERAKEEDERRSGQAGQPEKEKEKGEEETRKNTSNKKEKKLQDERAEEKERDPLEGKQVGMGEREKGAEVEEKGSALMRSSAGSIPEIRNDGRSVEPTPPRQPPLPLVLPTPRREAASSSNGGGKVEPARTTGQLSAGTDVGEGTPSGSGRDGDRDRAAGSASVLSGGNDIETSNTPIVASTPFVTSQPARLSSAALNETPSASSSPKFLRTRIPDELVTQSTFVSSTLRWNHTGNNRLYGSDDRQDIFGNDRKYLRKPASAVLNQRTIEEAIAKEVKRRRGGSSFLSSLANHRRVKGWKHAAIDDDSRPSVSGSMENRTALPDNENVLGEVTVKFGAVTESIMEIQTDVYATESTSQIDEILESGTTLVPFTTIESPLTEQPESLTPETEQSEPLPVTFGTFSHSDRVVATTDTTNNYLNITSTFPSTTTSTTEPTTTTSTSPPPVFPVTPKMLTEPRDNPAKDEIKPVDEAKTEANRPFGLAKDLDPSEIQKMYRSQTTSKPESIVTTIVPDLEDSTNLSPESATTRKPRPAYASDASMPRSPEVRGRNLSDKTKNDDILPIMELYNTSNIFNATGKDSLDSVNTARTTLQLANVNDSKTGSRDETTTENEEIGQRPTSERSGQNHSTETAGTSKENNKHDVDHDHLDVHSTRTKLSNTTNHASPHISNRTRHRPSYQQTALPEFFGYRPDLNSSFFEPGMIAVSPRESINVSEVITKRHDGDSIATQETVAVVSYILATLVVFPIAVGVGLILRRLIIRNRKVSHLDFIFIFIFAETLA